MSNLDPAIELRVNCLKENMNKLIDLYNKLEDTPKTGEWPDEITKLIGYIEGDLGFLGCLTGANITYDWHNPKVSQ